MKLSSMIIQAELFCLKEAIKTIKAQKKMIKKLFILMNILEWIMKK